MWNGMSVKVTTMAQEDIRMFPESRHRSKRVRKKLIKRHGCEIKTKPCAIVIGGQLIIHPTLYRELIEKDRINT